MAVADRVLIFENAYYSVISPKMSAILWKDRAYASDAAQALKLDANELLKLGIVDRVLEEPVGGAHRDWDATAQELQDALISELENLEKIPAKDLPNHRYEKFRKMGKVL